MCSPKQELRGQMKRLRGQILPEKKAAMDAAMRETFLQLAQTREADVVYCYASCGSEIDTYGLIAKLLSRGIQAALPRVEDGQIFFYRIMDLDDATCGYRGILEPSGDCPLMKVLYAPVLTPGLAFSEDGRRIGYGGGFYDRFFVREPEHPRIALAYPFQITDEIPEEDTDQRIHKIITPDRVIETGVQAWKAGGKRCR